MFSLFKEPPIKKQIDLYVSWKAIRYPSTAEAHRRMLHDFFRYTQVRCASNIDKKSIREFIESRNGEFYKQQAEKSLRGFITYWCKMGLLTRGFDSTVNEDILPDMNTISPRLHADQVTRVKKLREPNKDGKCMSFRQIKLLMETEDGRTYDLKQLHRWATYTMPESLSTHPKSTR